MATAIPLYPAAFRGATLALSLDGGGSADFTAAVVQVKFVPTPAWEQTPSLGGSVTSVAQGVVTWAAQVTYVQSFTAGSLARFLFDNTGKKAVATFTLADGSVLTATVTLEPGEFGGTVGDIPLATVELPCWATPNVVG